MKFDRGNVLAPDVLWISEGRMPADGTHLDFVPDLAVEVRSPSTWRYDTIVKIRLYEAAGVGEAWLVNTASKSVLVYRRSVPESPDFDISLELEEGEVLLSPLLEGFSLDITALFNQEYEFPALADSFAARALSCDSRIEQFRPTTQRIVLQPCRRKN